MKLFDRSYKELLQEKILNYLFLALWRASNTLLTFGKLPATYLNEKGRGEVPPNNSHCECYHTACLVTLKSRENSPAPKTLDNTCVTSSFQSCISDEQSKYPAVWKIK